MIRNSLTNPRMRLSEKLLQINWTMVFLIVAVAFIGFAMLYSAAKASFDPWAARQMQRFVLGLFLMLAIAKPIKATATMRKTIVQLICNSFSLRRILGFVRELRIIESCYYFFIAPHVSISCEFLYLATVGPNLCTSRSTSRAIGAAAFAPLPPCSTTTEQAYRGDDTGAYPTKSA